MTPVASENDKIDNARKTASLFIRRAIGQGYFVGNDGNPIHFITQHNDRDRDLYRRFAGARTMWRYSMLPAERARCRCGGRSCCLK
jgi:hypothetical protein